MNRVNVSLSNGYSLFAILPGEPSPMKDHQGGMIAADDEGKRFYIHESFLVFHGTDNIVKACNSYPIRSV